MTRATRRTATATGLSRFQLQARELNRRLAAWLDAGQPQPPSRQLRVEYQAEASRQLREARGLQAAADATPGTREDARYYLAQARRQPEVVPAMIRACAAPY